MATIRLIQGDITRLPAEAIVNAANSSLRGGGGVDGAIHRAGGPQILTECIKWTEEHGPLPPGEAMYTTAGKLPAKYVIHTVGPVWRGGKKGEDQILANAYKNSLRLAEELGVRQIAFPNISTGIYGFPKERAADIAIRAVTEYLQKGSRIKEVFFVCFDKENECIYHEKLGSDTLEIK